MYACGCMTQNLVRTELPCHLRPLEINETVDLFLLLLLLLLLFYNLEYPG